MCQSAADGGRRCLKHAAASSASTRYVWAKTGVDKDTIYGILKDLNKEGRKLEAPQLEEVKEFLRKEEFKTRLDPDLNERDRKLILKNLKKAEEEAEKQGMTGGAMHAYRNLFQRTMDRIKKPLLAAGLTGVLVASLAGCTGSQANQTPPPAPTHSAAAALCDPANDVYGDSVAYKEVKDSVGEYCQTQIDPKAEALKKDPSVYDMASLKEIGVSEDQAYAIQKKAVEFFAQEGLDSSVLDQNTNGIAGSDPAAQAWISAHKDLIDPAHEADYTQSGALFSGNLVVNGYTPTLVRDGKARLSNSSIKVSKVYAKNKSVVVEFQTTATYRANDKETAAWLLANDEKGSTESQLQAKYPALFDNKGDNKIVMTGNFAYAYNPANEKIVGNSFHYQMVYQDK